MSIRVPGNLQFFQKGKMQVLGWEFIVFSNDDIDVESGEIRESLHEAQSVFKPVMDA
jgi:hypothetical protein